LMVCRKAQQKCLARLKRLEDLGHELRRPEADYLRDGRRPNLDARFLSKDCLLGVYQEYRPERMAA
jgi:hypothetical protein